MTIKKIVGGAIMASPFVVLFSLIAHDSLIVAVCLFGGVAAFMALMGLGIYLIGD